MRNRSSQHIVYFNFVVLYLIFFSYSNMTKIFITCAKFPVKSLKPIKQNYVIFLRRENMKGAILVGMIDCYTPGLICYSYCYVATFKRQNLLKFQ